jgi:PHD/YefM family antitoxin component YafN of YafNO toxin-antitoxin module
MSWNIAQAKQQFSEVVRLSAQEPQAIYNRETAVATVINAAEYEQFKQWRLTLAAPTLMQQFSELRNALAEVGVNELELPPRDSIERKNQFVIPNKKMVRVTK